MLSRLWAFVKSMHPGVSQDPPIDPRPPPPTAKDLLLFYTQVKNKVVAEKGSKNSEIIYLFFLFRKLKVGVVDTEAQDPEKREISLFLQQNVAV